MTRSFRILHLEDSPLDAELVRHRLHSEGLDCEITVVRDRQEFETALQDQSFDLLLCDFGIPGYSGEAAIRLAARNCPAVPIVVLSGELGDEQAVNCLKIGATDYVLKDHLERLVAAIENSLATAEERRARHEAEAALRDLNAKLEQRVRERTAELENARQVALRMMQDAENQRQRAEETLAQLEASTHRLRMLSRAIENSPAVVVITDRDARIQYVNPKFTEITGYTATEVLGRNPRLLKSGHHPAEFYRLMWATLAEGQQWHGELCNRKKSGELYWESTSIAPIKDAAGEVTHYVAVKEDISAQRHFIAALEAAKRAAELANRAKSAFLANMSHEIRTPMNAILGFSQLMLRDSALTEQQRQHLDAISRNSKHLLLLLNDILEMSKIEAGRVSLQIGPCDLDLLLNDLDTMFRTRTQAKNLRFDIQRAVDLPRHVLVDESKLRQVLVNLLANAVKFTRQGQVALRVAGRQDDAVNWRLIAEVEDTGPGIASDEIGRLFGHFEQTETGRNSGHGTGLGLAISREFARLMGGEITVCSEPGQGTQFRLEIQVAALAGAAVERAVEPRRVERMRSGQPIPRILIVDDHEDNCLLLQQTLNALGFVAEPAASGPAAVAASQAWQPDLVVINLRMPGMDGDETIRQMRDVPNGQPPKIIAITASALEESRRQALAAGADAFLVKPFRADELFEEIRRLTGVEFLYAPAKPLGKQVPQTGECPETRQAILSLWPQELLAQMRTATNNADLEQLLELIDQGQDCDPRSALVLKHLAVRYEYESLIHLISDGETA
jgi:PAS domain S-box-containing protein